MKCCISIKINNKRFLEECLRRLITGVELIKQAFEQCINIGLYMLILFFQPDICRHTALEME